MADVTFECECPQSHVEVFIAYAEDPSVFRSVLFQRSGRENAALRTGKHHVAYLAKGIPHTHYQLTVTAGGSMASAGGILPAMGQDAGILTLCIASEPIGPPKQTR